VSKPSVLQFWAKGVVWTDRKLRLFTENLVEVGNGLVDLEIDHLMQPCQFDDKLMDLLVRQGDESRALAVQGIYEVKQ